MGSLTSNKCPNIGANVLRGPPKHNRWEESVTLVHDYWGWWDVRQEYRWGLPHFDDLSNLSLSLSLSHTHTHSPVPAHAVPSCTGKQCQMTFCSACYFDEKIRRLPTYCEDCGSPVSSAACLRRWANCIGIRDQQTHRKVIIIVFLREKIFTNFMVESHSVTHSLSLSSDTNAMQILVSSYRNITCPSFN